MFGILVAEIIVFSILALPIPSKFRKPLTLLLLRPFKIPTVQVAIKCILGFILLLFLDSINKVYNINQELTEAGRATGGGAGGLGQERIEVLSRKFFAQRNMYLTGITLFLTFIVTRTFSLVNELLDLKETYHTTENKLGKGKLSKSEQEKKDKANAELKVKLTKQIEETDKEIERLTEKATLLQKEME